MSLSIIMAIGAAFFAGWSYVKEFGKMILAIFIVTIKFDKDYYGTSASGAVLEFLRKNGKMISFTDREFVFFNQRIKSKNKYEQILFEKNSKNIYLINNKPIFLNKKSNDIGASADGIFTLSFIRGTFTVELLLKKIEEVMNTNEAYNGFNIIKCIGKNGNETANMNNNNPKANCKRLCEISGVPLHFDMSDLGESLHKDKIVSMALSRESISFFNEIKRWIKSEDWYQDKAIVWKLSAFIEGVPGTGKTTFIKSIANYFNIPIIIFDLSSMNNKELNQFWKENLNGGPKIYLLEDVDRIFDEKKRIIQPKNGQGITLDCLLNNISGVENNDGVLLFGTANNKENIDPALLRAGRFDKHLKFGFLSNKDKFDIASRILKDCPEYIEKIITSDIETGAQFERKCQEIALKEYWKNSES